MQITSSNIKENLEIVQAIFTESIKLDITGTQSVGVSYHSGTQRLEVNISYNGNSIFHDGLTRAWVVSVKNKELLSTVLKELQNISEKKEDLTTEEDDFLG